MWCMAPWTTAALRQWAAEDRIAPEDQVSQDQQIWSPAHDQPDLEMDWLIQMDDGTLYGPHPPRPPFANSLRTACWLRKPD